MTRSDEGKEQFIVADISFETLQKEKGKRVYGDKKLTQQIVNLTVQPELANEVL